MAFNNVPINGWPQIKGLDNVSEIPEMIEDISALETIVGDSSSGLVKDVSDLKTTVGDSTAGLVKTVTDQGTAITGLQTTVGDNNSGLVKSVSDINTALSPSAYLNSGLTFNNCALSNGGYVRIGNVVIINIRVSCSEGQVSIGGFPTYSVIGSTINRVAGSAINFSDDVSIVGYVNHTGDLMLIGNLNGKSVIFTTVYIADTPTPPETREEDQSPLDDTKTATIKRTKKS